MAQRQNELQSRNKTRNENYNKFVERYSPKQQPFNSLLKAFIVGGLICCFGQFIHDMAMLIFQDIGTATASTIASMVLIFLTALFTGIGWFDKLGMIGGGGTFLPITGFANSISSAAMEFRAEGMIFGLSSKFFSIAGAVIVNGVIGSFVVGVVYWIIALCGG